MGEDTGCDEGLSCNDADDGEATEERKAVILRVTDQPGLMDASGHVADAEHLRGTALSGEHQDGYHCLFVVEKITDRLDATEQIILRALMKFYGDKVCPHIVLLLTHSDVLDDEEEIDRMVEESRTDVEKELGAPICSAIAINNHASKADAAGRDRARAGRDMIASIYDVILKTEDPFKPPDVNIDDIVWYVDQEIERHPKNPDRSSVMNAVLGFFGASKNGGCAIL